MKFLIKLPIFGFYFVLSLAFSANPHQSDAEAEDYVSLHPLRHFLCGTVLDENGAPDFGPNSKQNFIYWIYKHAQENAETLNGDFAALLSNSLPKKEEFLRKRQELEKLSKNFTDACAKTEDWLNSHHRWDPIFWIRNEMSSDTEAQRKHRFDIVAKDSVLDEVSKKHLVGLLKERDAAVDALRTAADAMGLIYPKEKPWSIHHMLVESSGSLRLKEVDALYFGESLAAAFENNPQSVLSLKKIENKWIQQGSAQYMEFATLGGGVNSPTYKFAIDAKGERFYVSDAEGKPFRDLCLWGVPHISATPAKKIEPVANSFKLTREDCEKYFAALERSQFVQEARRKGVNELLLGTKPEVVSERMIFDKFVNDKIPGVDFSKLSTEELDQLEIPQLLQNIKQNLQSRIAGVEHQIEIKQKVDPNNDSVEALQSLQEQKLSSERTLSNMQSSGSPVLPVDWYMIASAKTALEGNISYRLVHNPAKNSYDLFAAVDIGEKTKLLSDAENPLIRIDEKAVNPQRVQALLNGANILSLDAVATILDCSKLLPRRAVPISPGYPAQAFDTKGNAIQQYSDKFNGGSP
jgi:hypothetical protein